MQFDPLRAMCMGRCLQRLSDRNRRARSSQDGVRRIRVNLIELYGVQELTFLNSSRMVSVTRLAISLGALERNSPISNRFGMRSAAYFRRRAARATTNKPTAARARVVGSGTA